MSEITELVYSPLLEEEGVLTGWSKSTIEYCLTHDRKINNSIRGIAKSRSGILSSADVEDIKSDLLQYLYKSDDYNISKAYSNTSNSLVSLEGYVHSCIKFVTKRYLTKKLKIEGPTVREITRESDDSNKELSIFDSIADTNAQDFVTSADFNLEDICRENEYARYKFGVDLFQVWYLMLITEQYGKQEKLTDILLVLGVSKKDISKVAIKSSHDDLMLNIAKAITFIGFDEAIAIVRKYVYCADKLDKVVKLI